ncbi:OmpH family outer membrane protein [Flexithrix dorotheae]|uniref:OmpH family outer membrane protein n=1 Tax=Flexithrix dorotheae TaxID=70993 RepID=UPI000363366B|nr:OmpH family outer membrane protein [Flexithrix dorotheae]
MNPFFWFIFAKTISDNTTELLMKFLLNFIVISLLSTPLIAQRFGYIDSNTIISQDPEYKEAKSNIESFAKSFEDKINKTKAEIVEMRKNYTANEVLMTKERRVEQLAKIETKEEELRKFIEEIYGYEGKVYLKRQEIIVPIQEKIISAINKTCKKNRLEFVFDKAGNIVIIYANPIHNFTPLVIEELNPKKEAEQKFGEEEEDKKKKPEPADRSGFIISEEILTKMPQYTDVLNEMEVFTKNWKLELNMLQDSLFRLKQAYEKDQVYLTDELKAERLEEINAQQEAVSTYQDEKFGAEGLIYTKRQDLLKPLQEKIFEATEKVAENKRVDFIFDKTDDISMIYANPIHNYTDYVLEELGLGDPADVVR